MMTLDRFEELVDAFGGDPKRWPEAERGAMAAFVRSRPEAARDAVARAASLDAVLDRASAAPASEGLAARILASGPRPREAGLSPSGVGFGLVFAGQAAIVRGGLLAAAVLLAGVGAGYVTGSQAVRASAGDALLAQAFLESEPALSVEG
jgi:hypothetical protein